MDHTLCKSEFLSFFIFIFPNRKQVAFVKNTLSDEYVEIILGGGGEKRNLIISGNTFVCHWGKWMVLLLQLLLQLWVISDPTCELRYPPGRSLAAPAASSAETETEPLPASADVQLI